MLVCDLKETWTLFLSCAKEKCTAAEYKNWFAPIRLVEATEIELLLEVPNIFVQEYLLENYREALPKRDNGEIAIRFQIAEKKQTVKPKIKAQEKKFQFNKLYTFTNFIEGPSNQFVKSAALGVASHPGHSYNPLFIHGGVGLGKTHLLHSIGHYISEKSRKLRIHCITTEAFINDLVGHLKSKSIDKMKSYYRSLDVLLVDDIQFLQNRLNFEEEFCNTFEALINQGKQIVITSDKPPASLKLSERLIARMEWGLVANIGMPDLETRVAILLHKADLKGLRLPQKVAFFIAEQIFHNVRQLEGAINRLTAYCSLMELDVTEEVAVKTLGEMFESRPKKKVSVDAIIESVATMFNVTPDDLRGKSRAKHIAFPRQVAMYLAKELMSDSLMKLASGFGGKTHSTLLHSWKKITAAVENDEILRRQIEMTKENISGAK
jgi:chromosomal replication initiator protein